MEPSNKSQNNPLGCGYTLNLKDRNGDRSKQDLCYSNSSEKYVTGWLPDLSRWLRQSQPRNRSSTLHSQIGTVIGCGKNILAWSIRGRRHSNVCLIIRTLSMGASDQYDAVNFQNIFDRISITLQLWYLNEDFLDIFYE